MRKLSSSATYAVRLVLPLAAFLFIVWATNDYLRKPLSLDDIHFLGWMLTLVGVLGAAFYWRFMRLRTVALVGEWLHIGDFGMRVIVPLREIARVRQVAGRRLGYPFYIPVEVIQIELRHPTAVGTKVRFMARVRLINVNGEDHPVVEELQAYVARASLPKASPAHRGRVAEPEATLGLPPIPKREEG
jgi:hypothetical protein